MTTETPNDVDASQDYDPALRLERIEAPLLAINFEDDLINPSELGVLERAIKRVPQGRAVLIPRRDRMSGPGTHTDAAVWKDLLTEFLNQNGIVP